MIRDDKMIISLMASIFSWINTATLIILPKVKVSVPVFNVCTMTNPPPPTVRMPISYTCMYNWLIGRGVFKIQFRFNTPPPKIPNKTNIPPLQKKGGGDREKGSMHTRACFQNIHKQYINHKDEIIFMK